MSAPDSAHHGWLESEARHLAHEEHVASQLIQRRQRLVHDELGIGGPGAPDDGLDGVYCERVLQHVHAPELAVRESLDEVRRLLLAQGQYLLTDEAGRYYLETVVPGLYPGRTRHIHVKVQAPDGPVLTTQLYFPGEPANDRDGIFRPELLLADVRDRGDTRQASFTFVLET